LAAFKKNSWALPITTLKLGLAGVSKVSLWFPVDGCFFFEEPGISINQSFQINPSDSSDGLGMTHRDIHFPCHLLLVLGILLGRCLRLKILGILRVPHGFMLINSD